MRVWAFIAFCFSVTASAESNAKLGGRLSHLSSFFVDQENLRHHRYELSLTQKANLSDRLLTQIEVRARADLALSDLSFAPQRGLASSVKNNELLEGEFREIYLDYLGDAFRAKVGLQFFDWIEFLSAYSSGLLTPLDLRFGAFGATRENLVPVPALSVNHKLGEGTLDWIFIPIGVSSRFPAGDNGYGYARYLSELAAPLSVQISDTPAPRTIQDVEFGLRYLRRWDDFELSAFAFRGHYRSPAVTIEPTGATSANLIQSHPEIVTLGAFGSLSGEAWILRAHALIQPLHQARLIVKPVTGDPKETLVRGGLGFDYVFSSDLKIYTEAWSSFTVANTQTDNDWLFTLRATNETFESLLVSLTFLLSAPHSSWMVNPEVQWTFAENCKLGAGGHVIVSTDREAMFYPLRDSDQLYLQLAYHFGL